MVHTQHKQSVQGWGCSNHGPSVLCESLGDCYDGMSCSRDLHHLDALLGKAVLYIWSNLVLR